MAVNMQRDYSKVGRIKKIGLVLDQLTNRRKRPHQVRREVSRAAELAGIVDTMIPTFNFMGIGEGVLGDTEKYLRRWIHRDQGLWPADHMVMVKHPELTHIQYIQPTAGDRELVQTIIALNGIAMLIHVFRAVSDLSWCRRYFSWEIAECVGNPVESVPLSEILANRVALRKLSFGNDIVKLLDAYEYVDEMPSSGDDASYTVLRPLSMHGQVMAIFSRLAGEMLALGGAEKIGLCKRCWRFMYISQYTKQYCSSACRAAPSHDEKWLAVNMQAIERILSAFNLPFKPSDPVKTGPAITRGSFPSLGNPFRRWLSPSA